MVAATRARIVGAFTAESAETAEKVGGKIANCKIEKSAYSGQLGECRGGEAIFRRVVKRTKRLLRFARNDIMMLEWTYVTGKDNQKPGH